MAFVNEDGFKTSYESNELIAELKEDIAEFGGDTVVNVWCKDIYGITIYTNYDFIEPEQPVKDEEIEKDEYLIQMTMTALLILLEKQNDFF